MKHDHPYPRHLTREELLEDNAAPLKPYANRLLNDLFEIAGWRYLYLNRQPGDWLIGPRSIVKTHQRLLGMLREYQRQERLIATYLVEIERFVDELDGKMY